MGKLEDIILEILTLRSQGANIVSIASQLDTAVTFVAGIEQTLSRTYVSAHSSGDPEHIANHTDIDQQVLLAFHNQYSQQLQSGTTIRALHCKELYQLGRSQKQIAQILHIGQPLVSRELKLLGISKQQTPKPNKRDLQRYKNLAQSHAHTPSEIASILHIRHKELTTYAKITGVQYPKGYDVKCRRVYQQMQDGATLESIAKKENLTLKSTRQYMYEGKKLTQLPQQAQKTEIPQGLTDKVLSLLATKKIRANTIAQALNVPVALCIAAAKTKGITVSRYQKTPQATTYHARILQGITEGIDSIEELCNYVGANPSQLGAVIRKNKIRVPDLKPFPHKPSLDNMITAGATYREMGDMHGFTREWARLYVLDSGQLKIHKDAKSKNKEFNPQDSINEKRQQLLLTLKRHAIQKARTEGFAATHALAYVMRSKLVKLKYDDLHTLFSRYEQAQATGKRIPYTQLSQDLPWHHLYTGKILQLAGLPALAGYLKKRNISKPTLQAITRAASLDISAADVAHFLSIPKHHLQKRWKTLPRPTPTTLAVGPRQRTTWRTISMIYEAQDAKLCLEETMEYAKTSRSTIQYALDKQKMYRNKLINDLGILFPHQEITRPYKTW